MAWLKIDDASLVSIADAIRAKTGSTGELSLSQMTSAISGISGFNDNVAEYNQQNAQVTAYLSAADSVYTDSNYASVSVIGDYATGIYDDPAGYTITAPEAGVLHLIDEDDPSMSWSEPVGVGTHTIYNLIPTHHWRWYVVNSNGTTMESGKLHPTGIVRMIYDTAWSDSYGSGDNMRDFGGWSCDGGKVRYGLLYRSAVPKGLSAAVRNKLKDCLRIRQQISLFANSSSYRLWDDVPFTEYDLTSTPLQNLTLGGDYCVRLTAALRQIMALAVQRVPVCLHCWAGSDRTGIVSWILHALLGVSEADCDKDYELTCLSGNTGRVRTSFAGGFFETYGKDTMLKNVLHWCEQAGIEIDEINAYRKAMIDGIPTDLAYEVVSGNANLIPLSTDASGNVFNGSGHRDGYRLNSSGSETAADGFSVTGYMPASYGDKIVIQNCLDTMVSASHVYVAFYDSSFNVLQSKSKPYLVDQFGGVLSNNNMDIAFTIANNPSYFSNLNSTAYIRLSYKTGTNAILYVDNGQGASNIIDEVGYTDGNRLSTSAGTLKAQEGYTTTGFIEISNGDIIRTSGVDFRTSTHGYSAYVLYSDTQAFTTSNYLNPINDSSLGVAFDASGNMTFEVKSVSAKYVRFCGYGSGAAMTVTVNQEI